MATVEKALTSDPRAVDVSIVMPCLNEAQTLGACIGSAKNALAELQRRHGLAGEVVVADNGSTDGSIEIAESTGARIIAITERGYGNALRGGIAGARGSYVVMGDCDCSYDFMESVAMVEQLLDGFDLCMGSRFKGTILPGAMPWKNRYIGNPALTGILNLFFGSGLSDAHCGMRAFTKAAFERLRLSAEGMEFASEMVIKAALLKLSTTEVPITLHPDRRNRPPHLKPWHDGWRHLRYLLMLSPAWLFFVPSAIFSAVGVTVFSTLLFARSAAVIHVGPLWFGDHWMILSGAMLAISHQLALFGAATLLYGSRSGYRRLGRLSRLLLGLTRLEYMLVSGAVAVGIGAAILFSVVASWSAEGYGGLQAIREMVAVTTFGMLGLQNIFGGFLLSIVRGNRARVGPSR
jgi:glycosyltransferase involved in cell wall biosynthesis